ncbi:MAG: AbrB/MazE/SpoVT family DNA-binding domain-containing protein [Chloroflexi bacterium]|nr:AbrB/MazE/SpoVT family DNA-binding domain-containing protein [Chloroflexota bacterium]
MRISAAGQITIPKGLRERSGLNAGVEAEVVPIEHGLLTRKREGTEHPVDRIAGILVGRGMDVDAYINEIRSR